MELKFHTIKKSRMKTLKRWFDQEHSSGSGLSMLYLETDGKEFGRAHAYSYGQTNMLISSLIGWICRAIFVEKLDISLDDLLARVTTRYHEERRRHERSKYG